MSSSALFFSSATPVSDLPVVVFAPATPQIDSDAPPELVSRVSCVLAEPIAAPARARTVEDEAPMDGPETETDAPKVNWVFYDYVPEVLHSLESNSAPVVANLHISHMHIRRRAAPPRRRSGHARKSAPRIRRLIRRQPYPAAARWCR